MSDVPATLILQPDELLFSGVRLNQVRHSPHLRVLSVAHRHCSQAAGSVISSYGLLLDGRFIKLAMHETLE